jgi:hypothetical protein
LSKVYKAARKYGRIYAEMHYAERNEPDWDEVEYRKRMVRGGNWTRQMQKKTRTREQPIDIWYDDSLERTNTRRQKGQIRYK